MFRAHRRPPAVARKAMYRKGFMSLARQGRQNGSGVKNPRSRLLAPALLPGPEAAEGPPVPAVGGVPAVFLLGEDPPGQPRVPGPNQLDVHTHLPVGEGAQSQAAAVAQIEMNVGKVREELITE